MGEMDSMSFAPARGGRDRRVRNDDGDVVLQLIEAAVGYHVSGIDAVNLRETTVSDSWLYAPHMGGIVLNHVYERRLAILLDGRGRNQCHSLQRIHQQPRIHKLVRKQCIICVGEQ
jgi:hypothetical protein